MMILRKLLMRQTFKPSIFTLTGQNKSMSKCIFCEIVAGSEKGSFIAKGKNCSAFLDIGQINPGHILVVPNWHFETFEEVSEEVIADMIKMAQEVYKALIKSSVQCDGGNIFISSGKVAGQEIKHFHIHIVPRFKNDGRILKFIIQKKSPKANRAILDQLSVEIKKHLQNFVNNLDFSSSRN